MLYRKAYAKLLEWKLHKNKKALCIVGARQIGKTTLVRAFAKAEYKAFLEINFITEPRATEIFAQNLDAQTLIANLTAYARKKLPVGQTLILLDEIQECPNARTAIKFLVEDGRFDYIETGALLGVSCNKVRSYPVGFEEVYHMYPMSFEEFALANGVQAETLAYLKNCMETVNMGSILENVMAQELRSKGFALRYFDSKRLGELDFVVQIGADVDILEIKSGNDYKKHAALNKVSAVAEWNFKKLIVLSKGNVEQEEQFIYLPWYMVMFIETAQIPLGSVHELDLSALRSR